MTYKAITTETIRIRGHQDDDIEAYVARPQGSEPVPGIVIIHHMPGWDEWTTEVARKLAHHGYAAISPNLFSRHGSGAPEEVSARARTQGGLIDDQVMGDVAGAANYIRSQQASNGKTGIIGFCSGGRHVFIAASRLGGIDAAVDCWGGGMIQDESQLTPQRPVSAITLAPNLACPLLGLWGNEDVNPPPEEVDRLEEELKRHGKTYEFYRYDGAGHAFWVTDRHVYRAEQAVDAWGRAFAFFDRYLRTTAQGAPARWVGASPTVQLSGHIPLRA